MGIPGRGIPIIAAVLAAFAAESAEDPGAEIAVCRGVADDARRLACYDRIAGREQAVAPPSEPAPAAVADTLSAESRPATPAAPPAAPVPVPAAGGAAAESSAQENFGLERAQAREEAERQDEKARELGKLEATVTAIEKRFDGLLTISLDNGQVWRQNTPDSKFRLKQGDRVRIQPGSLKSYILSGPTNKSTRVTRVK
jgi:hypothetical protein